MNATATNLHRPGRWRLPLLWLAPWAFYLLSIAATVTLNVRGVGWMRVLVKDEVILALALVVVLTWLVARIAITVSLRSPLPVIGAALLELPLAFFTYLFWVLCMIGPLNAG